MKMVGVMLFLALAAASALPRGVDPKGGLSIRVVLISVSFFPLQTRQNTVALSFSATAKLSPLQPSMTTIATVKMAAMSLV